MDIIDCHAHIFRPLAHACGFDSAATHRRYQQRAMHVHENQPVCRARDNEIVREKHLWDPNDPSEAGRREVNFRVGKFGRFEWDKDGEAHYIQFLPPTLQDMSSPAEQAIVQMDYAGIRTAVLHNDHIYGNLAEDFADAARRYPGRFIGLAQVDPAFAWREDETRRLVDQVERLGMRGLYFTLTAFFRNGYRQYYDDVVFDSFWHTVARLRLPVFWVFLAPSPIGDLAEEMRRFRAWYDRHPDIVSVLVHGVPTAPFMNDGRLRLPEILTSLLREFPVYSELLYPIGCGGRMEYPYAPAQQQARQLFDLIGPDRMLWGSDMPNVERYCTYRQSLTWIFDHCDFMGEADKVKVFGSNTLALFEC